MLNTLTSGGRMTASTVPEMPRLCTMEYSGMMVVSTGTMSRNMMRKLMNPLPGKLNFAITYPARALTMMFPTTTASAYPMLLSPYFQISYCVNTLA